MITNIKVGNNGECQEPGCLRNQEKETLIINKKPQLGDQQGDHG
jgi:hypothetical protein